LRITQLKIARSYDIAVLMVLEIFFTSVATFLFLLKDLWPTIPNSPQKMQWLARSQGSKRTEGARNPQLYTETFLA
jgi:hypothetical protein